MDHKNYFKDLFESTSHYRKIVLLMFIIKKDADLLKECGSSEKDFKHKNEEFRKKINEQKEEYLD